jgi:hypothetical protein
LWRGISCENQKLPLPTYVFTKTELILILILNFLYKLPPGLFSGNEDAAAATRVRSPRARCRPDQTLSQSSAGAYRGSNSTAIDNDTEVDSDIIDSKIRETLFSVSFLFTVLGSKTQGLALAFWGSKDDGFRTKE